MDSLVPGVRRIRLTVLAVLALLILLGVPGAPELRAEEDVAPEVRREQMKELARLLDEARKIHETGTPAETIEALEALLVAQQRVFGPEHDECAECHDWLAELEEARGDFARARMRLEEVRRIHTEHYGPGHWRVRDANRMLEDLGRRERLTPDERRPLREARDLHREAYRLLFSSRPASAIPVAERALSMRRRLLGDGHPDTLESLSNLARIHMDTGDYSKAEPLCREAIDLGERTFGADHPGHAGDLFWLADLLKFTGEFAKAERLYRRTLEIEREAYGEEHPATVMTLNTLAMLYRVLGDYARAEPLYRQALEFRQRQMEADYPVSALGTCRSNTGWSLSDSMSHCYATSLLGLAALHWNTGEYERAVPLIREALGIRERVLGVDHPACASSLSNLATLHETMGEYGMAEPLFRRALEVYVKAFGEGHRHSSTSLNNLARLYRHTGEYAKAEARCREALGIREKALGTEHPAVAMSLSDLALIHECRGEYDEAEPLHRRALEIRRKALGENHPSCARSLHDLARLQVSTGEYAKAEPLCRQALEIRRKLLDATFVILSERQQLRMTRFFRGTLDLWLSLSARTDVSPAEAYAPLLAWKGAVLARQSRARLRGIDPESAGLLAEYESTSRRLATLSISVPDEKRRAAWHRQIAELTEKKEALERDLSRKSETYREVRAAERLAPAELQRSLPEDVTLVDVTEYSRSVVTEKDGRRTVYQEPWLVAFLIAAEGEPDRVELGPAGPIARAIESWRSGIRRPGGGAVATELRRLVWEPLEKRLGGSRTVLLSPDGALNRLPLGALPGKTPGTYLIEEISVAVVPVPRLLPGLLASRERGTPKESLLVLGDVDYGGLPGRAAEPLVASRSAAGTITGALPRFEKLPATRGEILAIRDSFETRHEDGAVRVLRRARATEEAFRREAGKHRWLHLATHGFFAPASLRSALAATGDDRTMGDEVKLAGYHPGLLCGLALSGANTPPEADGDDGILTALEVASLDLSGVEVAVLSACETGLGEVAGGEGVLGLQRAFQVAGVRTTATSLWKVPDEATRMLMRRFYENLWDRGVPKLEALREAQLWLMREGGERGVRLPDESKEASRKLPPFYWAGFVLSGDWR